MNTPLRKFGRMLLVCGCAVSMEWGLNSSCLGQTPPSVVVTAPQDTAVQTLTQMLRDYVDHFNQRDFDSLAKLLDAQVQYRDENKNLEGAKALVDGLRKLTTDEPEVKLSVDIQQVDVANETSAKAIGIASLVNENVPTESARFTVTFAKSAEHWTILSIEETSTLTTSADAIESLQWLIGNWQDANDPSIQSTVQYTAGNQFLQRIVQRQSDGETVQVAVEMIGYDPVAHQVRSWLFFADGSFGTGVWQGEADHCRIRLQQTLADGSSASGTYVIRPISADSMTIQLTGRVVNGELQPNGSPITLTRIAADTVPTASDSEVKP